jgi:hypothetical protein
MGEQKEIIKLYEGLLDKLTDQNKHLKDWIRSRKRADKKKEMEEEER